MQDLRDLPRLMGKKGFVRVALELHRRRHAMSQPCRGAARVNELLFANCSTAQRERA
jgi:hypothetical protein